MRKTTPQETTVFVYNAGGQLVAEYSTRMSEAPRVSYLTADHLGSPRVVTDENGAVKDRKDYSAFGEETVSSQRVSGLGYAANGEELRKGYTGYEKDTESGLDFAQARYYNSVHGRFTSVDPLTASASIRNPQTFNRYSYVLNSPYKYVDPLGLAAESPAADAGCNFRCRVNRAINGTAGLSDADKELALFQIRNGTALGYTFLEASYNAINRQTTQSRVVATTVTLSFSVENRLLTVNRSTTTRVQTYGWKQERGKSVWGRLSTEDRVTTETFEIGGSSGYGECMNNPACATDSEEHRGQGPIPIGSYVLDKDKITMLNTGPKSYVRDAGMAVRLATGLPVMSDFGSFRVDLTPTAPMLRSGFMLHGGRLPGSLGCIDVGGGRDGNRQTTRLLELLRSSDSAKIALTVTK